MKKILLRTLKIIVIVYIILCGLIYLNQEKLIFFPEKLEKSFQFKFDGKYEELNIKSKDGTVLNGLLFKADSSKGLIFYLHGNEGSLRSWGGVAKTYTDFNYDIFILDYRGYGKSEGKIKGQKQLFDDVQNVYNELLKIYNEDDIVVLGYSIGTGIASKIASTNNPKLLILQSPYYSLIDMMKHTYPIIPTFILKYKLKTNIYLKDCSMPVIVFHGNQDRVIYYGSSLKLESEFKSSDILITLDGQGHNGMTNNADYKVELERMLNDY